MSRRLGKLSLSHLFLKPTKAPSVTLNSLSPMPGSIKKRKRVGRGPGSGLGKTSGRGHKGQKGKSHSPKIGFEGGQTPFYLSVPKHGFKGHGDNLASINLDQIEDLIRRGRIDPSKKITIRELVLSGGVKKELDGIKLLARGSENFQTPIDIEVTRASQTAIKAIEKANGKILTIFHNRLNLRAMIKPEKFDQLPLPALPLRKAAYWLNPKNRGYLAEMWKKLTPEEQDDASKRYIGAVQLKNEQELEKWHKNKPILIKAAVEEGIAQFNAAKANASSSSSLKKPRKSA